LIKQSLADQSVSFDITVQAGVPLQEIVSTYHRATFKQRDTSYRVTLSDSRVAPDHDFELAWTPAVHGEPAATLFREKTAQGEHVLLMLMPPHERVKLATPREVIFIIDTSGSMEGGSIMQARAALLKALGTLTPTDKFNVIQFNSVFDSVFPNTVPSSDENLRKARTYVSELVATGGTEMLPALRFAMNTPVSGEFLRQIIFITDGAVGNEDQLTREIHTNLGNARLFTVGIGSAPNGFFMRKAAEMGRGTFTYIGSTTEVDAKMTELINKVEQPALTNIQLTWPRGVQPDYAPSHIGDLYAGEPLVVTALLPDEARGTLLVSGVSSSAWTRQFTLGRGDSHKGISTLWARYRIAELMDQQVNGASDDAIRTEVLPLALQYKLVSKYTSLVAIDKTPARDINEPLKSQRIPNTKPDGSAWQTVAYPKTATPAQLQLLTGLVLLSFAAFFSGWRTRRWK
jgi:Ca-activated chloride channel family protein